MAFTMYSYFNSTTGDLVISGQEETLDGYTKLNTPSTNPTTSSQWPWHSNRGSIKTIHVGTVSPIDMTRTASMFSGCSSLTSLDLSSLDTSQVTHTGDMFNGCSSITSLDLSSFDTSKVTRMDYMFYDCENLKSLDLSSFNTSQVTDMEFMFQGCSSLTSLDLSSFNASNVTDMTSMFSNCPSLALLDLSSFDTSHAIDMRNMFYNCSSLTSLDLSAFNTSQVTRMGSIFSRCQNLTSLNLSPFDTSKVTDMSSMFSGCSKLTSLDLSSFDTSKVTSVGYMFNGCSNLHIIDIPTTAANIVSELPKDTYYDAATGTQYPKADIPGGSAYIDDPHYMDMVSTMIQTREGLLSSKRSGAKMCMSTRKLISSVKEDVASMDANLSALGANNITDASNLNFYMKHSGIPKHLVCIGDSWSIGYGLSSPTTQGWNYLLASDLGMTLHNFADGGAGFHHVGNTGTTFLSQANSAVSDNSFDHDDSIVIILGNLNDLRFGDNVQNIITNAQNTFNTLRTGFPNSRIIYITVNTIKGIIESTSWISSIYDVMQKAVSYGIEVYTNIMSLFYGTGDEYKQDENHPNASGHSLIANWVKSCILNSNDAKVFGYKFQQSFNAGDGITANYTLYKSDIINLTLNLVFSNNITGSIDFTIPDYFVTQIGESIYAIDAKIYKRTSTDFSLANDMILVTKAEPNTLSLRANTTAPTSVTIVLEFAPITSGSIFKNIVIPS